MVATIIAATTTISLFITVACYCSCNYSKACHFCVIIVAIPLVLFYQWQLLSFIVNFIIIQAAALLFVFFFVEFLLLLMLLQ